MLIFTKKFILGIILACDVIICKAVTIDSLINLPAMAIPVVNYSPETSWVFGLAAQGYFKCPQANRTSIVQLDGAYSLNRQWYINTSGNIYCGRNTSWLIQYKLGYRDYPDYLFLDNTPILYNSKRFAATVQPQYCFTHNWALGLDLQYINETTDYNYINNLGYGIVSLYDSRDVTFYPHSGIFFKTTATCHSAMNKDAICKNIAIFNLDFRHFVPIYKDLIFAYQVTTTWAVGNNIPFQVLPTLGGQDLLRGVRRNQNRDKALIAIQAELRFPIWDFLKGSVFCGVGDTYNYDNWIWKVPQVGYGIGLRASVNKAKVNIRVDIARNNMDKSWNTGWSYYLTATEAF